jgi:hypothetical protein
VDAGWETSLISLVFPYTEEVGNLSSVVDRISEKSIPYRSVVWEDKVVVTLELPMGMLVNPSLVFDGGVSFTAVLTPDHSLSTFDGLTFGNHTVFLRDYGVEIQLKAGIETVIAQSDLTDLWTGSSMQKAARVSFSSDFAGIYVPILKPDSGTVAVKQQNTLLTWQQSRNLGGNESASLVVTPPTDTETVLFSVVTR